MNKLLLDTNFIVAYILPNDSLHKRAVKIEEDYKLSLQECYVTNQIITEVINILGQKDSVELAINTYYMMKDSFHCINEYEINNFNQIVIMLYKKLNKRDNDLDYEHKLGFTDCSIISVAKEYNLDAIVSFDSYFLKNSDVKIIC